MNERSGRQASPAPPTPVWHWLLLLGGFALIFWWFAPKCAGPNPPPAAISWIWWPVFAGVVVIVLRALAAFPFLRNFDRGVRCAEKRAQEGDLDGAIADLREQIEEKGQTQIRVNTLGIFLLRRERWDEAAAMFRKAEQIGKLNKGVCRANLGLALLKGGKPAEAIPVLQDAASMGPHALPLTCIVNLHMSLALAELRRWDEAEEQFRRGGCGPRSAQSSARRSRKSWTSAGRSWSSICERNRSWRGLQSSSPASGRRPDAARSRVGGHRGSVSLRQRE